MELHIAGGCGDEGRNCFFVKGRVSFLLDAGTSTDGNNTKPDLTKEEIQEASYLFLSHSHRDHTGAIAWLEENGFKGTVIASPAAYGQLHEKPEKFRPLPAPKGEMSLPEGISVSWGRTGHCAGAAWYEISEDGKTIVYSGDYRSGDPCYETDPLENRTGDIAILDGSYSLDTDGEAMRKNVLQKGSAFLEKGPLVLPVPHHGRGLSIAVLFYETYGKKWPAYFSPALQEEWKKIRELGHIVKPLAASIPLESFRVWDEKTIEDQGLYFLTDAQLAKEKSALLFKKYPHVPILLTGHVHGYGNAAKYVSSGQAALSLWPNHMTVKEAEEIRRQNDFKKMIIFHNTHKKAPAQYIEF